MDILDLFLCCLATLEPPAPSKEIIRIIFLFVVECLDNFDLAQEVYY